MKFLLASRKAHLQILLILLSICIATLGCGSAPQKRLPNIVFVFIDDMGYGDLSIYGNGEVQTENIDRLAAEGTRFTNFYVNSPICSPSRVAVTTGMYPSRWRIHSFLASSERNARRDMANFLDPSAPTLARALKDAGYATAHFGKWHMGGGRDVGDAPLPREYGFDESSVSFEGLGERYLWPSRLSIESAELGRGRVEWTEKHEKTRIYVDKAIDFMQRHRAEPFYINLWPNDVHDAHIPSTRPGLMEKYEKTADNEYEQKFFAVLDEMDRQLGRLFDELDRLGLAEETLIVLASDNGPTDWPRYYDQGIEPPGSTGRFLGRKWSLYEGGIRVPMIIRWTGRVPAGRVDDETVFGGIDLPPSLAAVAGTRMPAEYEIDGEDVSGAFFGEVMQREAPLYWLYPRKPEVDLLPGNPEYRSPNLAVRDGRWKLLINSDGTGAELYDLEADSGESNNLARANPDVVKRLSHLALEWRRTLP